MNENYLQFIWKVKRIPFHLITTTNNQSIEILQVGTHNLNDSGPDFLNGKIKINELEWCGNIEVHIKSSDWYKHNHQLDLAYANVILHVVFEHDCEVMINDEVIPTIELKDFIDAEHFERWSKFASLNDEINCRKSVQEVETIYLESMKERAIVDRLKRKVFFLQQDQSNLEDQELLYFLVARAFGAKVNQFPFEELAMRLPLQVLKKFSGTEQHNLVQLTSGMATIEPFIASKVWAHVNRTYRIGNVSVQAWKRKGVHAASRPEKRIAQFTLFIQQFDFNLAMIYQSPEEIISAFYLLLEASKKENELKFSKELIHTLLINCIVPFLWWFADKEHNESFQEKALKILEMLPAEKNAIIRKWNQLGIKPRSAFDSQALIEIYNEHCSKNKCISCEIGVKILKK